MRLSHDFPPAFAAYATVLAALGEGRRSGPDWYCRCPAHEDRSPSLCVSVGAETGNLLLHCKSGCSNQAVLRAAGIGWHDCFPPRDRRRQQHRVTAVYEYRDELERLLYVTERIEWYDADGHRHKRFSQRRPDPDKAGAWLRNIEDVRRVLYRLPELLAADPKRTVLVVAGEKDADTAYRLGMIATTNVCGERSQWLDEYSEMLTGRHVAVVPDRDGSGLRHAAEVAGSLVIHEVASVRVAGLPAKDLTAYVEQLRAAGVLGRDALRGKVAGIVREAPLWRPVVGGAA